MMYHSFPNVGEADRLNRAAPLDISAIRLTPQQAYERLQLAAHPESVRIVTVGRRPAYRFEVSRGESIVYADNGALQDEFDSDFARRVAAEWTGQQPSAAAAEKLTERDQWTVSGEFKPLEPIWKYSWPDGEQVYVSTVTGDVVQYTTRASRIGAYFGAIPHWLYFAPLRKHAHAWSRIVIWMSGLAAFGAIAGLTIGIGVYSPGNPYRYGGASSGIRYIGAKRLHMILGLFFGVIACTWAFSGMLSMDPFPKLQGSLDESGEDVEQALRGDGVPLGPFDEKPAQIIAAKGLEATFQVKELDLVSFAGQPVYIAKKAPSDVRIISLDGQVGREFDFRRILDVVQDISRPARIAEVRAVTKYEAYYLDRHGRLPLPAIYIRLDDPKGSSYYIDPKTARVIESYNSHSRWNRWLYHGLHSIDLPWLYAHRPVWDVVILILLSGGLVLAATATLLASRVLRRGLF